MKFYGNFHIYGFSRKGGHFATKWKSQDLSPVVVNLQTGVSIRHCLISGSKSMWSGEKVVIRKVDNESGEKVVKYAKSWPKTMKKAKNSIFLWKLLHGG